MVAFGTTGGFCRSRRTPGTRSGPGKADATLETFIGEPGRDRLTGISTIYLARRVHTRNGDFLGLVLGAISLEHFEKFFQSVSIQDFFSSKSGTL